MISLPFGTQITEILCLGAHCDDIEIGCGASLMTLARAHPQIRFTVAVFASSPTRAPETRAAMQRIFPAGVQVDVQVHEFRDGFFPAEWSAIKQRMEDIKRANRADLVLTHHERDRHQDHRVLSELAWNTFRNHLILEYEIPKYDGDLGQPSVYVPLTSEIVDQKISMLLDSFPSQAERGWFTADLFRAQMRIRGMECNSESGFAEAFYARKVCLQT